MTEAIIQTFWYVGLGVMVAAMLAGLLRQQIYEIRIRRRLDRRIRSLRRR